MLHVRSIGSVTTRSPFYLECATSFRGAAAEREQHAGIKLAATWEHHSRLPRGCSVLLIFMTRADQSLAGSPALLSTIRNSLCGELHSSGSLGQQTQENASILPE